MHLPKFTNISEKNSRLAKENPGPKMPTQSHRTYRYIHELREALRHRCGNGFVVSTFVALHTHTKSIPLQSHSKMFGKWFETENEQQKEVERPQERKKKQQRQKATRQSPNPM